MSDTMKALDKIVDVLCKHLGPQVLNQDVASDIDIDRHDDFRSDMQEVASDILALPTLRAALAPAADDEVEVGAIKQRHEYAEQKGGDLYTPEYCEWSFSQCHHDRATLLRHVARLTAELEAERGRRVEVERIKAAIDEALTMACDERDEAYSQFDKLKEATGPFTWYLSSSVFDDRPDDDVPQTTEDAGRRVPRLGDYRRLRAALNQEPGHE